MTWARGNDGIETTSGELIIDVLINLGIILASSELAEDTVRLLLLGLFGGIGLALTKSLTIVILVPLTEGGGINLDDGSLD